jgi:hypothetical protein
MASGGSGMLAVIQRVYDGGKDVIEVGGKRWNLMELARRGLDRGGVEGLKEFYERMVNRPTEKGKWVVRTLRRHRRQTLESQYGEFMAAYRTEARR